MSREKQIEEMAECLIDIQQNFNEYCAKPCRECELGGIVNCENHYKAEALYNAGYRKQSEGEWIDNHCTACGMSPIGDEAWTDIGLTPPEFEYCMSFCPCCGAKMKGGEGDV